MWLSMRGVDAHDCSSPSGSIEASRVLGGRRSTLAASVGTASGAASSGQLEVNVMNEPVRGGEPELAVNPRNPANLVIGHTAVGNTYANNSSAAGRRP